MHQYSSVRLYEAMSTQTVTKKRKSIDGNEKVVKKVKVSKSADKPAPLKSALKKATVHTSEKSEKPSRHSTEKTKAPKAVKSKKPNGEAAKTPVKAAVDNENEDGGTKLTSDQTAALLAGFSSSEDEAESENEAGIAVSKLPKAPTTGLIQKRIKQAVSEQDDPETTPGVIYIGRIPHGFFEPQMKAYLSQFGEISNLKLARNRKTGKSKHYAFVEFASAAVADIVAKTMDKYLLFNHILQVARVPREQVKEEWFKGSGRRNKKPPPRNRMEGTKLRQGATREEWEKRVEKENERRTKKAEKLKEMGYEFEMPVVRSVDEVPIKVKVALLEDATDSAEEAEAPVVEEAQTEAKVANGDEVVEKPATEKRSASGKTATKKAVKKVKA